MQDSKTTTAEPILPPHIHLIASYLDYPSVYMGGPSHRSIRKAERIWEALRAEGYVKEADDAR